MSVEKRIILIGGPHDMAYNPLSNGPSVRDYIGDGDPPPELCYGIGPDKLVYRFDTTLNLPPAGKSWKDNDNYVYVLDGLSPDEIIKRLTKNYGRYEKLLLLLDRTVPIEKDKSGVK